jgi:TrmH family RNA methyltransferase
MQIVATLPGATTSYWQLDLRQPTLILLGNEGAGLSTELSAIADRQVSIPLSPGVESLNVAIAAALLLYEARRQRDGS